METNENVYSCVRPIVYIQFQDGIFLCSHTVENVLPFLVVKKIIGSHMVLPGNITSKTDEHKYENMEI